MANEGSTNEEMARWRKTVAGTAEFWMERHGEKVRELDAAREAARVWKQNHDSAQRQAEEFEASLARVRGLLQRQSEALEAWLQVFYPVEGMGLAPLDYGLKEDVVRLVKQSRKALSRRTLGN